MAATVSIEETIDIGGTDKMYIGTFTMDDSYATGGETLDAANNERFKRLLPTQVGGYVIEFIPASQKAKFYRQKDPANAGGADIALPEVASGVDLSAITVPFVAVGN